MTPMEIDQFIRSLADSNRIMEVILTTKKIKKKNINPKHQKKNFPKMIGLRLINYAKNNELLNQDEFLYSKALDIDYPENYNSIVSKDNFLKWLNTKVKAPKKLYNLPGYRQVFYYRTFPSEFETQHYRFLFKRLALEYLENHASREIIQKYVKNIYQEAAKEYLDLIPLFLRGLHSENGFLSLAKQ